MEKDNLIESIFAAAAALCTAETVLRLKHRNEIKTRYQRERWTVEKTWERFDLLSGWELTPGFSSDAFDINSHGFRGQELVNDKTFRIVCLGDSVTFGQPGEKNTYPSVIQKELAKIDTPLPVEVINAGINGQSSSNMIFRISRIMKLKPDIILILAGWNDLFFENIEAYTDNRFPFGSYWDIESQENTRLHLLRLLSKKAGFTSRKSSPLSYSPKEFIPFNFEYNLNRIIARIQRKQVKTAIITLPKLMPDDTEKITPTMLKKLILPEFIAQDDFESFLKVYNSYNTIIKKTAEENGIPVFDAESTFGSQKRTRSVFFEDTCHLSSAGNTLLGKFIAKKIVKEDFIK
ncbi:SGNH/GDSL hydrolase family protein [Candidatus Latescibacterota bacterium]